MIVKVVSAYKNTSKLSFPNLAKYVTQNKRNNLNSKTRNVYSWIRPEDSENLYDDIDLFLEDIKSVQDMNKRAKGSKTYHLVISFAPDERPNLNTMKAITDELVKSIGYENHQHMAVVHDDTDNLHIHVAINKINKDNYKIHEPYYPYKVLSLKAKELEKKFNLVQTHSNTINKDYSVADDIDSRLNQESFKKYISKIDLSKCETWEEFAVILKQNGIQYGKYGSGAVFKDITNNKINIKASSINRDFSLKKLEEKFGDFKKINTEDIKIERTYQRYLSAEFRDKYNLININRKIKSKKEKDIIKNDYTEKFSKNTIISDIGRVTGATNFDRFLMKLAKKEKIKALKKDRQKELKKITDKYRYYSYEAFLIKEALYNKNAADILNNMKNRRINYIKGDFKELEKNAIITTKNGTHILDNNIKCNKNALFTNASYNSLQQSLDLMNKKGIIPETINGTDEYKNKVINIIASRKLDVTFKDEEINKKILAAKILNDETLSNYINEKNEKIPKFEKFSNTDEELIYQGFIKHNDKYLIKLKSVNSNIFYIKEPVTEDYFKLRNINKGDKIVVKSQIKNSYAIESFLNQKDENKIQYVELTKFENDMKKVATHKINNKKVFLYKKENDKNIYVSTVYHKMTKIKNKNNEVQR